MLKVGDLVTLKWPPVPPREFSNEDLTSPWYREEFATKIGRIVQLSVKGMDYAVSWGRSERWNGSDCWYYDECQLETDSFAAWVREVRQEVQT